jgi:GNAT superfamily N-acetyltransferase
MHIQHLATTPFPQIAHCFLKAFEHYYVPMPVDPEYYFARWKAAMVDYSLSFGVFDQQELVGFVLHAVDTREDVKVAYNAATGVLPAYRKKGVVQQLYTHALPLLTKQGIEHIRLEVITQNEAAIRAYQKVGFEVARHFHCFKGTLSATPSTSEAEVQEVPLENVPWNKLPNQTHYSWENQKPSLLRGSYRFFQVLHNNLAESFFIVHQNGEYLAQVDVLIEGDKVWNRLFAAMQQYAPTVKLNNVDHRLTDKLKQLKVAGLQESIAQYEMELSLTP